MEISYTNIVSTITIILITILVTKYKEFVKEEGYIDLKKIMWK